MSQHEGETLHSHPPPSSRRPLSRLAIGAILLVTTGCAVGLLFGLALPAFERSYTQGKSVKVETNLRQLTHQVSAHVSRLCALPEPVALTPPRETCCYGEEARCVYNAADWEHPAWVAMGFDPGGSTAYSYALEREGDDAIIVRALSELSCDGQHTIYTQRVRRSADDPCVAIIEPIIAAR